MENKTENIFYFFYLQNKTYLINLIQLFIDILTSRENKSTYSTFYKFQMKNSVFFNYEIRKYFLKSLHQSNQGLFFFYILEQKHNQENMLSQQDIFFQINSSNILLLDQLSNPILQSVFKIGQSSICLTLTKSYVFITQVVSQHTQITQAITRFYCPLTFSTKFQVIRAQWESQRTPGLAKGICFERQNSSYKIQFICDSSEIVETWAKALQKKINQRNFHKLFKAKRKIGKGAFATVYLAQRLLDGKLVAVKSFSKQKQYSGDKGRQSLQNQIKIMRILDHPNVMKLQGIYETQNSIYVILEYLQGVQLNQEFKNNKQFNQNQTKTLIKGLLKGLSHLSEKRVIHRDLKPQNILFKRKDSLQLTICDFGLATQADQEKYLFVRCGTPGFVAPQIINIRDMSIKSQPISDIFSAGIIFHYLLLNKSIFQGTKYSDILAQNRSCELNFNKEQYTKLNSKALDLLIKMLQKRPQFRISAQQALKHPFLDQNVFQEMQIQENKSQQEIQEIPEFLFKQKNIQIMNTPSTLRSYKKSPQLKKKNSKSPISKEKKFQSFYSNKKQSKENFNGITSLKKNISNTSNTTKSKSRCVQKQNKMIDQIYQNQ